MGDPLQGNEKRISGGSSASDAWSEIFRYATPDDAALPSGSAITVHPVLNTEPNVIDSGWIRTGVDGGLEKANQSFVMGGNTALNAYVINASDDLGNNIRNADFPFLSTAAGEVRVIAAEFFTRYFRVIIENTSGSTCTELSARSTGGQSTPAPITTSLDQLLFDQFPAPVTRAVGAGKNPNGVYENVPLGGTIAITPTPTPLGIGATYTSDVIDTNLYPTLLLLAGADKESATSGLLFEWSETEAFTVVRSTQRYTFRVGNITDGLLIPEETRARYLRLKYTNGATAQTRFFLNLTLHPTPLTRTVDIKSTTAAQTGQLSVTATTQKAIVGPLTGRKAVRLKNMSSSANPVFFGFTAGTTVSNGDELAVGEAVELDLDEFVDVYVVVVTPGGGGTKVSWTEIGS